MPRPDRETPRISWRYWRGAFLSLGFFPFFAFLALLSFLEFPVIISSVSVDGRFGGEIVP
jgi:hypothetical protein